MIEENIVNLKSRMLVVEAILSDLLSLAYRNEFVVIDGMLQHPMGYGFSDWLIHKYPNLPEMWRYE